MDLQLAEKTEYPESPRENLKYCIREFTQTRKEFLSIDREHVVSVKDRVEAVQQ